VDTSDVQNAESENGGLSVRRRRYRSVEVKRQIVEETFKRGASVAVVARRHGVNANQLFAWRRHYQRGALTASQHPSNAVTLVPIEVNASSIDHPVGPHPSTPAPPIERIEIEFGGGRRLSVQGRADLDTLRAVIRELSQP
jgi:transposase